ncbi:MAG: ABC transporter ATP-binding protein [Nitrospinae bacterium]|nr:ABC transporter ATP-binding protein [Nitrospinota bacterium]
MKPNSGAGPYVVEVENLVVRYKGRVALDGVTLRIAAQRFAGIIGPNGAGKTTLLRALLGLVKPESGIIKVFGHPPGHSHNLIGYVPQSSVFESRFPIKSREVVMMGRYGRLGWGKAPGKEDQLAVDDAITRVGILDLADKRFGSLSGGERQKVLIARALCAQPKLLLLDEPTTGVDILSQDSFYTLIKELLLDLKMTVVLVSHDVGVISSIVDDLICINQRVFCHDSPANVIAGGVIGDAYGSQWEILMHGHAVPHRLVSQHGHKHEEDKGHD